MKADPTLKVLKTMCNEIKSAHVTLDNETLDMYMEKYLIDIMVLLD